MQISNVVKRTFKNMSFYDIGQCDIFNIVHGIHSVELPETVVKFIVFMSTPYIIDVSSDEDEEEEVKVLEFRKETDKLLDSAPTNIKKLKQIQCPICFDEVTNATIIACGHIFCLECISQSISSSYARGQTTKRGIGLCPLCRKSIAFKDAVVLRLKLAVQTVPPVLPKLVEDNIPLGELQRVAEQDRKKEEEKQKDLQILRRAFEDRKKLVESVRKLPRRGGKKRSAEDDLADYRQQALDLYELKRRKL